MVWKTHFWKWYGVFMTLAFLIVWLNQEESAVVQRVFYQQLAYKEYTFADGAFKLSFPATVHLQSEFWGEKEVLYNLRFFDPKYRYHGLVQKWKIQDLKSFLQSSRDHARRTITDYELESYTVNERNGYLVSYTQETTSGTTFHAMDLFLKAEDDRVFRIVYFVADDLMNEDHRKNFHHIVQTFDLTL